MSRRSRARAAAVSLAVFATLAGGTAIAYFTTTGAGSAAVGVSNLPKSTITSATPAVGGSVTVNWSAVSPPEVGTVNYYLTRDGESAAGTCPTSAAPTTVRTCVDKGLDPGNHTYEVTAVWRSWTSESAPVTAKVTVGAATQLDLSAASATPVAGASTNLTITAEDSAGTTVTTYTGAHSLVFSGASAGPSGTVPTVTNSSNGAVAFGATTAVTFASGASTRVMRLYRAEPTEVTVSDGTLSDSTPLSVNVSTAALSKFVLGFETTTPAVGAADDLTISAQDTYGNVVPTYTGIRNMTFSGPLASPNGTVPTVTDAEGNPVAFGTATPIEFDTGLATTQGSANGEMRLYKSAAAAVKVTETPISSATVTVTAQAGPAVKINLAPATTTPVAGASVNLTITAQDAYANTVTAYTGAHSLVFGGASPSPAGTAPTVTNSSGTAIAFGTTTAVTFASGASTRAMRLYRAEPTEVTVSDGAISNLSPLNMNVSTAALSKFVLGFETTTPAVGAADDLTISAQDTYGNVVPTYTGIHNMTFSGPLASPNGTAPTVTDSDGDPVAFGTATPIEFDTGLATTQGSANGEMRLYKSAAAAVKVTETPISSATVTVTAQAGPAVKFVLGASTLVPAANATVNLTTTAQDAYANTVTTYAGAHILTFTGAGAAALGTAPTVVDSAGVVTGFGVPMSINFTNGVAAVASSKNGLMRLYLAGATTIVVSDGSISNGAGLLVTVSPTTAARFVFTNLKASAGVVGPLCLATCTVSLLGNSGTIIANVAVTDTYGNMLSNLGTGHTASVTTNGGTVSGGSLPIPSTGLAESATQFTFTAQVSGIFTDTIKAAASAGTAYTNSTITATK